MSTHVFPSFNVPNMGYPVKRTPMWNSKVQDSISGMEVRLAYWTSPKYKWAVDLNALQAVVSANDFATFMGFYNARQGQFDTFLYSDPDDSSVVLQPIASGDGTTLAFPLVKTFGGFVEPVLAPNAVAAVYVDGVDQVGHWTVSSWGSATPGILTFAGGHAPTNAKLITATFTYYYPCRFLADSQDFDLVYGQMYQAKKVVWQSVKN